MCYFTNLHKEHKLLKIEELKTKIQNEMINIDNTYEKVDKEVTKSYELKHEILFVTFFYLLIILYLNKYD